MPPYPETHSILNWVEATRAVNEIRSPNVALQRLLFSNHETHATETIEFAIESREPQTVRFSRPGTKAVPVDVDTWSFHNVSTPLINLIRPLHAVNAYFKRTPSAAGQMIFTSAGVVRQGVNFQLAKDMQVLADFITDTIEYMCALALRGSITIDASSYSGQLEDEAFTIDFGRTGGATQLTAGTTWGSTGSTMMANLQTAKRDFDARARLPVDFGICGKNAADRIRADEAFKTDADRERVDVGFLLLQEQFNEMGLQRIGRVAGIEMWEYSRTVLSPDGSASLDLIRPDYVELVSRSSQAGMALHFGAIADFEALQQGVLEAERFSKTWLERNPSAHYSMVQSRPLPILKRPNATYSIKTNA